MGPIIIEKTSIKFCLIGPLNRNMQGVLIKSSDLNIEFIGLAKDFYFRKTDSEMMLYHTANPLEQILQIWSRNIEVENKLLQDYYKQDIHLETRNFKIALYLALKNPTVHLDKYLRESHESLTYELT